MKISRPSISVPAQLEFGTGVLASITVSDLSEKGCKVAGQLPQGSAASSVSVWLGAVGPLRGHLNDDSGSEIEFEGEINPMIVRHFCA